jgi:hypothetical protein
MEDRQITESRPSFLVIKNETLWPISVIWTATPLTNGSTVIKKYNTIVNANSEEMLGVLSDVATLSMYAYGQVWSKMSRLYPIPIATFKKNSVNNDGYVIIKESWSYNWKFDYVSKQKSLCWHQRLPEDILSTLPGVLRAKAEQRTIKAHHVLNIDPANVTDEMLENSYKRLLDRWQLKNPNIGNNARIFGDVLRAALISLVSKEDREINLADFQSQL